MNHDTSMVWKMSRGSWDIWGQFLDKVSQLPFVHRGPIGDRDRDLRRGDRDRVRLLS